MGPEIQTPPPDDPNEAADLAAADRERGRLLRRTGAWLQANPTFGLVLLVTLLFGRHEAARMVGLEREPAPVVAASPADMQQLKSAVDGLAKQVGDLDGKVVDMGGQLNEVRKELLDVALQQGRHNRADLLEGPKVAQANDR